MKNSTNLKPIAFALGTSIVASLSGTSIANASDNPFGMSELSGGYMVADAKEGKCGEGKCGGDKKADKEGKFGEGKCGGDKKADKEGKCGEGKCGGNKKADKEGKCGGSK